MPPKPAPRRRPPAAQADPATLHVIKTLRPPQPGTRKLLAEHGDALVCVRYRRDAAGLNSCTTVELVVQRKSMQGAAFDRRQFHLWISRDETALREMVRAHGGRWQPDTLTWRVDGQTVKRLRLQERIVTPGPRSSHPQRQPRKPRNA